MATNREIRVLSQNEALAALEADREPQTAAEIEMGSRPLTDVWKDGVRAGNTEVGTDQNGALYIRAAATPTNKGRRRRR